MRTPPQLPAAPVVLSTKSNCRTTFVARLTLCLPPSPSYEPFLSYALSKLANVMTALELQRRMGRCGNQSASNEHVAAVAAGGSHAPPPLTDVLMLHSQVCTGLANGLGLTF